MFEKLFLNKRLLYLGLFAFSTSICSALQLSNHSNIFKILGVSSGNLPWLWLAPPLTGLIIQPLVGQISDDTATRFGKRMPYIIGWGFLAVLAILLLPFATSVSVALFVVLLLDCSINGSSEALRALTTDVTKDNDRSKALCMQGFFSGIGAAIGTSLPYFIHRLPFFREKFVFGHLPDNLRYAFFVSAIILILTLVFCMRNVKEKIIKNSYLTKRTHKPLQWRIYKIFRDIFHNVRYMSHHFRKICFIHAIAWIGIFIFWLYFSTVIAQNIYHVPFVITANLKNYAPAWAKASLDTSFYLSIYQYVSIFYAFILYFLPKSVNLKLIHVLSLIAGGIGICTVGFEYRPHMIIFSCICIGIMWGSMITIPYVIAMQLLPKGKVGIYLGIFNICITLPQLLCGLLLSPVYTFLFHHHAGYLMGLGGGLILFSAYLWIRDMNPQKLALMSQKYLLMQGEGSPADLEPLNENLNQHPSANNASFPETS